MRKESEVSFSVDLMVTMLQTSCGMVCHRSPLPRIEYRMVSFAMIFMGGRILITAIRDSLAGMASPAAVPVLPFCSNATQELLFLGLWSFLAEGVFGGCAVALLLLNLKHATVPSQNDKSANRGMVHQA